MISIGDALLKLGVDSKDLEKGMADAEKNINKYTKRIGLAMMGIGTAITAALIGATVKTASLGDEIAKMSKRTGIGTVALSEMRYAAKLSGTSLAGLETAIKRMQVSLVDASQGTGDASAAIETLGLNLSELMAMTPEQQFYTLAGAIAAIDDPTIRTAMAIQVFGRAGTDMLPMLSEGAAGLEKMRQEAHKLGIVYDEEAAKKSEAFMDATERLKESLGKVGAQIGMTLMPILTELIENKLVPIIQKMADWIEKNPELIKNLLILGGVLIGAGGLLFALSQISKAIIVINTALVIMHGLSGPAGWAKMAAGLAVAGGIIYGMNKLMAGPAPAAKELPTALGMQFGGTVPGTIGQPVPIIAHGGEEFLGAQNIGRGNTVNINLGLLPGDDVTIRKVARIIKDVLGEDSRRNSFGQVNQGYFYGRSSV